VKIERHFATVHYPQAEPGTVIPNIALDQQQTHASGFSGGQLLLRYTPTLPYEEARKLLLFAHKICFEDPIAQMLEPIIQNINNRAYEIALPPRNVKEAIFGSYLRVEPPDIQDGHLSLLRETFLNTQRLEKLIRAKIVIPQCTHRKLVRSLSKINPEKRPSQLRLSPEVGIWELHQLAATADRRSDSTNLVV